ncbi:MAG: hypothetical protein RIT45_4029 [Pseudomonadota bacterium]|jgi:hypothetical protein
MQKSIEENVTPELPVRTGPRMALDDEFYCRPRRRRLSIEKCLDDYMNANAFTNKRSACWRCPQGCTNRRTFSESA